MMRFSNSLVGVVNFLTFLLSVPILGGGIWLSSKANTTDCLRFLQWPLIIIGVSIMVVSLAGFVGACYRNTFLLWFYLFTMFFIIAALIGFIIFAYGVTDKGSGRSVSQRAYLDYYLSDYSGWLKDRVEQNSYWSKISSCVRDSHVCSKMGLHINGVSETADMFYLRKLNPIQSGCCKPPSECGYVYENETMWNNGGGTVSNDLDCTKWSNDQTQLCYACDSCKAGVLASIKKSWRKVSVINIVVLILLVIFYIIGFAAFRNNKRIDNDEPYGSTRMTKAQPSRIQF
ncbi:tetraspanin-3-like [Telopea speciosissima]|uniref:tetraspanin-3-like n=1 Tax=Telopea speciosissima TaxID=54955 RepID=UPI001CC77A34|nr:tetraspanin-3-like [Telopea speciosissima]XP_043698076.1 tetraspanin-3-like [Telopea speciosissima]XP_043698077.1 tetraspanin-3-like [Telopea speciosissima]